MSYEHEAYYKDALKQVEDVLKNEGRDRTVNYNFRSRYKHTLRVIKWVERLSAGNDRLDMDALYMAAIFHDIGKVNEITNKSSDHAQISANMFLGYAYNKGFDKAYTDKVHLLIKTHSDKHMLRKPETLLPEQITLMEADMLDEEGALSICWDGLSMGMRNADSYEEVLNYTTEMYKKKVPFDLFVTDRAKKIWLKKLGYINNYIRELSYDLEAWNPDNIGK